MRGLVLNILYFAALVFVLYHSLRPQCGFANSQRLWREKENHREGRSIDDEHED